MNRLHDQSAEAHPSTFLTENVAGIVIERTECGLLLRVVLPKHSPCDFNATQLARVIEHLNSLKTDWSRFTGFQQDIYRALRRVPWGKTVSYTMLSSVSGHPGASRAAGTACARNPWPLLIPCHRVVAANGSLAGFSYGLDWKRHLIEIEKTCQPPVRRHAPRRSTG